MTNFDKWKEELTIEDIVRRLGPVYECCRCPLADTHEDCARRFGGGFCKNKIAAWANAPAKEEE